MEEEGFWDWLFCSYTKQSKHTPFIEDNKQNGITNMIKIYIIIETQINEEFQAKIQENSDIKLEESTIKNQKSYAQLHILNNLAKLPIEDQKKFKRQLDFIQFDLVDSVRQII